jgi:predicted cobalt transporter CbtA
MIHYPWLFAIGLLLVCSPDEWAEPRPETFAARLPKLLIRGFFRGLGIVLIALSFQQ